MRNSTSEYWRQFVSRFWIIGILLVLGACAGHLPKLTPPQLEWAARRWPKARAEQVVSGRRLYVLKCSGCHTLKLPGAYPAEKWPKIMEKMGPKTKLSKEQEEMIMRYITTVLEGPASPESR